MSESKRHHFVPQSILRRFAAPGSDKVWIYDKQTGASFASSVLQTGMERGFNVVVIDGKRINFEGDFNDVDGRMADLHTRLVDSRRLGCLSTDDRNHLADAAAVQLLRTKRLFGKLVGGGCGGVMVVIQALDVDAAEPGSDGPDCQEDDALSV